MFEREPLASEILAKPEIGALAINGVLVEAAEICQLGVESDINYLLPNLTNAQKALNGVAQEFNRPQVKPDYHAMLRSGAHYVASFANPHKGYSAGRQIYLEEHDIALNDTYTRHIIPSSAALKNLRVANHKLESDFDHLRTDESFDVAARYQIFKTIVYGRDETERQEQSDTVTAAATLTSVIAMENADIRQQIVQDSTKGIYDRHIAYDLLRLGDQTVDNANAGKIHELLEFARADWQRQGRELGQIESYTKMLETFDSWPPDYRYLIIGIRQAFLEKFEANIDQTKQALEEENIIALADAEAAFKESYLELDKRLSFSTKAAKRKNRVRLETQSLAEQVVSEEIKNPKRYNLMAAHPDGVGGLIKKYVEDAGQDVNGKLHEDLKNLKKYLEHVTIHGNHYAGIKVIRECRYIWQNGKKRTLYEAKPKDMPGLSTTAVNSDDVRAFFIRLEEPGGESELGILEILDIVTKKNVKQTLNRLKMQSKRQNPRGKTR